MSAPTRLGRLAQRSTTERVAALEQCELCGTPIPAEHRHVLEVASRELKCVCRPCSILFDRRAAAEGRYRLVPDRRPLVGDPEPHDGVGGGLRPPRGPGFF